MSEDPKTIGRYEVVRRIARGGMGTVYLVNARGAGGFVRRLAVKQCHPHLVDEPEFVARFLDEGRIAARIHHPNVVATIDVVHEGGADLYLVMEYVDGAPLAALTKRSIAGEVIPLGVCVRVAADALAGLEAAHTLADDAGVPLGVAHRDVSPQNIIVGRDGLARLTDFGIARARDNSAHSREGEVRGKFGYMAPEQLLGSPVDARADVFAMGVVLWELVAGHAFRSSSSSEAIASITSGARAEAPSVHGRAVPAALEAAILKALARDPAARQATAAGLVAELEAAIAPASHRDVAALVTPSPAELTPSETVESPPPVEEAAEVSIPRATAPITVEVAEPPRRARWVVAAAAAAGVVTLGGVLVYAGLARHAQQPTSAPPISSAREEPTIATATSSATSSEPPPPTASNAPTAHATAHVHAIITTRPSATTHKSSAPWHPAGP